VYTEAIIVPEINVEIDISYEASTYEASSGGEHLHDDVYGVYYNGFTGTYYDPGVMMSDYYDSEYGSLYSS